MSETIKVLINQVIVTARQRGLTQAALAEKAGLTAVGLSKAKHRGDLRASTLDELASQVDLELTLQPRRSREQAAGAVKAGRFFGLMGDTGAGED